MVVFKIIAFDLLVIRHCRVNCSIDGVFCFVAVFYTLLWIKVYKAPPSEIRETFHFAYEPPHGKSNNLHR